MTVAELLVLFGIWALLLWCLRPLQRALTRFIERKLLRRRHGDVIEGKFKPISRDETPRGP